MSLISFHTLLTNDNLLLFTILIYLKPLFHTHLVCGQAFQLVQVRITASLIPSHLKNRHLGPSLYRR